MWWKQPFQHHFVMKNGHFNTMNDENWPFLALKHIQNTPFHDKIYNKWWKFTTCGEKMTFLNTLFNTTLWWKMDISYKTPPLAVEWPPFYTKMDTSHTENHPFLAIKHIQSNPFHDEIHNTCWKNDLFDRRNSKMNIFHAENGHLSYWKWTILNAQHIQNTPFQ